MRSNASFAATRCCCSRSHSHSGRRSIYGDDQMVVFIFPSQPQKGQVEVHPAAGTGWPAYCEIDGGFRLLPGRPSTSLRIWLWRPQCADPPDACSWQPRGRPRCHSQATFQGAGVCGLPVWQSRSLACWAWRSSQSHRHSVGGMGCAGCSDMVMQHRDCSWSIPRAASILHIPTHPATTSGVPPLRARAL